MTLLSQPSDVGPEISRIRRLETVGKSGSRIPRLSDDKSSVRRIAGSRRISVSRIGGSAPPVGHFFVVAGAADGGVRVVEIVPVEVEENCHSLVGRPTTFDRKTFFRPTFGLQKYSLKIARFADYKKVTH